MAPTPEIVCEVEDVNEEVSWMNVSAEEENRWIAAAVLEGQIGEVPLQTPVTSLCTVSKFHPLHLLLSLSPLLLLPSSILILFPFFTWLS